MRCYFRACRSGDNRDAVIDQHCDCVAAYSNTINSTKPLLVDATGSQWRSTTQQHSGVQEAFTCSTDGTLIGYNWGGSDSSYQTTFNGYRT
jgi:hypothetical protein